MGLFDFGRLSSELHGLRQAIAELQTQKAYSDEVVRLKKDIADLEIGKSKLQEEHDKQDRELRHMIGLEKRRQEFEIESAKKEAVLVVREENLIADRKRFEEQLRFHDDRFAEEVGYLKDLMSDILKRLPNVNMTGKIS